MEELTALLSFIADEKGVSVLFNHDLALL